MMSVAEVRERNVGQTRRATRMWLCHPDSCGSVIGSSVRTSDDAFNRSLKVAELNRLGAMAGSNQRRFIADIGKVSARKSGGQGRHFLCHLLLVHIRLQRLEVHSKNVPSPLEKILRNR